MRPPLPEDSSPRPCGFASAFFWNSSGFGEVSCVGVRMGAGKRGGGGADAELSSSVTASVKISKNSSTPHPAGKLLLLSAERLNLTIWLPGPASSSLSMMQTVTLWLVLPVGTRKLCGFSKVFPSLLKVARMELVRPRYYRQRYRVSKGSPPEGADRDRTGADRRENRYTIHTGSNQIIAVTLFNISLLLVVRPVMRRPLQDSPFYPPP